MNTTDRIRYSILSIIVGILLWLTLTFLWGHIPELNPVSKFIISCCIERPWFQAAIAAQDLVINILICLPFALIAIRILPKQIWLYVGIILVTVFISGHYHLLQSEYAEWDTLNALAGLILELLPLPIAIWLINRRHLASPSSGGSDAFQ